MSCGQIPAACSDLSQCNENNEEGSLAPIQLGPIAP